MAFDSWIPSGPGLARGCEREQTWSLRPWRGRRGTMNWSLGPRPLSRRLFLLAVVSGTLALSLAAGASATTTIGQTTTSPNYFCTAESDTQPAVASGPSFVVPAG